LDWSFAHLIAPVVTTTSIILSSNKIQNGHILLPANPGPPGNGRENGEQERERKRDRERQKVSHYIVKLSMVQSNSHNSGIGRASIKSRLCLCYQIKIIFTQISYRDEKMRNVYLEIKGYAGQQHNCDTVHAEELVVCFCLKCFCSIPIHCSVTYEY